LQTRRFLDTLKGYLEEVQRALVALVRAANERPEPFVDHAGMLRDSKTGRRINGAVSDEDEDEDSMRASSLFSCCLLDCWSCLSFLRACSLVLVLR
jgi:carnitine O-acetyltransferase